MLCGRTYELDRGYKTDISTSSSGFIGKAPRTFPRGGGSRPPPYGNRVAPRTVAVGISMVVSESSRSSPTVQIGP
jgi:hypothetical protein